MPRHSSPWRVVFDRMPRKHRMIVEALRGAMHADVADALIADSPVKRASSRHAGRWARTLSRWVTLAGADGGRRKHGRITGAAAPRSARRCSGRQSADSHAGSPVPVVRGASRVRGCVHPCIAAIRARALTHPNDSGTSARTARCSSSPRHRARDGVDATASATRRAPARAVRQARWTGRQALARHRTGVPAVVRWKGRRGQDDLRGGDRACAWPPTIRGGR